MECCRICSKESKNKTGLSTHIRYKHDIKYSDYCVIYETKEKVLCEYCKIILTSKKKNVRFCSNKCRATAVNPIRGKKPYNYNENKFRNCITCDKKLHSQSRTGYCREHYITTEYKLKLSETAKKFKVGGYRRGSGRGKKGWYKGYWCDSSWELAWIIYNINHDIKLERNTEKFNYLWKGEIKRWIPDFIINDEYHEIKGFYTEQNQAKFDSFNNILTLWYFDKMEMILNYVKTLYGKDFIKLYE